MNKKTVCIVTPDYINSNPRTVKEADALHQAGFNVRVVFSQGNLENIRIFDKILLKEKQWKWDIVGWSPFRKEERILYYKSKLRFHIAKRLHPLFWQFAKLAEYAEGRVYKELAKACVSEKADIYIGHYPAGLAAAAFAAFKRGAKLGYDVEDLYTEEQIPPMRKRRIELIERRYLPHCSYVTVASELFADEMVKRYSISPPLVIYNVFPWAERENLDGKVKDRQGDPLSLYWFSQTIGENRGIEDAIRAAGLLEGRVQIHLRGNILSESVRNKFIVLARECRVEKFIYFHLPVPPKEILSRITEHDIGLALEQPVSLNRMLCITNKIFYYQLAGLAIAATDTPGQKHIISNYSPEAGFLYKPGDYQALADNLNKLISNPDKLRLCKQAALKAAQERWNWEIESRKFIENISRLLEE